MVKVLMGSPIGSTSCKSFEVDGLKAAEMLAKMCGWNEPERVNVQSVEVKVDAALIEQLRAGYAELGRRQQHELAASVAASSEEKGDPACEETRKQFIADARLTLLEASKLSLLSGSRAIPRPRVVGLAACMWHISS
jgi:hypothetical protein